MFSGERKSSIIPLLFLLLSMLVFISCESSRKVIKEPIKEHGADYLLQKLNENEFQFETVSAKFSIKLLIDKKEMSFNGQYRLKKDSVLWISFSPLLGIEALRVVITNDSVKYLDRINKTYFSGDKKYVSDFLNANVDFDVIQSLLMGNDLTYYENSKFRASYDKPQYQLVTTERRKLKSYIKTVEDANRIFIQNIFMNPETFKISRMKIKEVKKENIKLEALYDDFEDLDGQLFPMKAQYIIDAENKIEATVEYSKLKMNQPLNFPFKITSKYKPL